MAKNDHDDNYRVWPICVSFGLTIGISIYVLGFLLGGWLDDKYATEPLFTLIGTLLAIASSFARLLHDFYRLDHRRQQEKEKGKVE